MTADRPVPADYRWHRAFPTRWHDNDVFGHLNNVIYYAAMDTTVTSWLLANTAFSMTDDSGDAAVVVASSCRYHASGAFPDTLLVGLRADRVGTTSIAWGLGIFREADEELLATGTFVHVFVDRADQRPVTVPAAIRERVRDELVADGGS